MFFVETSLMHMRKYPEAETLQLFTGLIQTRLTVKQDLRTRQEAGGTHQISILLF
jgi:hypothetical protein